MYSALGSESAFRDGLFSQAAPPQGFQRSVREYGDGSLGAYRNEAAYRDGMLGNARNDAAYRDGALGATTQLMVQPTTSRFRRPLFPSVRGLGLTATRLATPTPLSIAQRRRLLDSLRYRAPKNPAMRGYGADAPAPVLATMPGPNWLLIIGGGAALAVAVVVMMSGKKRR